MTREEEIHNAAMDVSNRWKRSELLPTQDEIIAYDAAVTMAKWADQHPRKGLWDAEKVIEWLENHVREFKYYDSDYQDGNIDVDGLIETLTKAMED